MTTERSNLPMAWARLRFTVVSDLLSCPPARGELGAAIRERAAMRWEHPATGEWITFGASTIERWYYAVRDAADPVAVLLRQVRCDRGRMRVVTLALLAALQKQYTDHQKWSYTRGGSGQAAPCRAPRRLIGQAVAAGYSPGFGGARTPGELPQ